MIKKHFTESEKFALLVAIRELMEFQQSQGTIIVAEHSPVKVGNSDRDYLYSHHFFDDMKAGDIDYIRNSASCERLQRTVVFKSNILPLAMKVEIEAKIQRRRAFMSPKMLYITRDWKLRKVVIITHQERDRWYVLTKIFLPEQHSFSRIIKAKSFKRIFSRV